MKKKEKMYDPDECNSFQMQFGYGMSERKNNSKYTHKRKYYYPDKRTKAYGAQRVELLKKNKDAEAAKKFLKTNGILKKKNRNESP